MTTTTHQQNALNHGGKGLDSLAVEVHLFKQKKQQHPENYPAEYIKALRMYVSEMDKMVEKYWNLLAELEGK